jgi:hypothetical protein
MKKMIFAAVALAGLLASCNNMTTTYKTTLSGANEVPAVAGTGMGDVTATLDMSTQVLTVSGTYMGLTGPAAAGHIHGPAVAGTNAGVLFPLVVKDGVITGTPKLTTAQIDDLAAGKYYVNVHTAANAGGEIRGQLGK